jgi:hypothetical protein
MALSVWDHDWWVNNIFTLDDCKFDKIMFNILRGVSILAWIGSLNLMVYQYRKGLGERWYSLKSYWYLNFIVHVYATIFGMRNSQFTIFQKVFSSIEVFLAFLLVGLLLKTKDRSGERPRHS